MLRNGRKHGAARREEERMACRGTSILEALISLTLLSFVLLAALDLQIRSLARLNGSQTKLTNYTSLQEWQPADLSGPLCGNLAAPDGRNFLRCARENGGIPAQISTFFVLE